MLDDKLKEKIYEINDLIALKYDHLESSFRAKFLSSLNYKNFDIFGIILEDICSFNITEELLNLSYEEFCYRYYNSFIIFIFCNNNGKVFSTCRIKISNFEIFNNFENGKYTDTFSEIIKSCVDLKHSNTITFIENANIPTRVATTIYFNNKYKNNSKNQLLVDLWEYYNIDYVKYVISIYGFSDTLQFLIDIKDDPTLLLDFFNNKKFCVKVLDHERYLQEKIQNKNKEIQYLENKLKNLIEEKNAFEEDLKNDKVKKTMLKYCDESLFDNRALLKELNL